MKRVPLVRRAALRRSSSPRKRDSAFLKPSRISPASPGQRAKVKGRVCVNCAGGPCDPAHLASRAHGGCDHPDCVIPLCRRCHRDFDEGRVDLEPVLALRQFAAERSHMAFHLTFEQCRKRLRGIAA